MRKTALLLCVLFLGAMALSLAADTQVMGKTHDMTATIVSVDTKAKTLTIKDEKGETKTAPVLSGAVDSLKTVKAGDKVVLTCQDDEKGNHKGISAIKPAPSTE